MTDSLTDKNVADSLGAFLQRRTGRAWGEEDDLFASGAVSSMFAMELVTFIEGEFGVAIGGPDLRLDNFRTPRAMVDLVGRLREGLSRWCASRSVSGGEMTVVAIRNIQVLLPDQQKAVSDVVDLTLLSEAEQNFAATCGVERIHTYVDRTVGDLCVEAASRLPRLGADEEEALIVLAPRAPDILIGSTAAEVQHGAGLTAPLAFCLGDMGYASSTVALEVARDLLLASPQRKRVSVVFASLPAADQRVRFPVTVIGDGALAFTVERDGGPRLLAHASAIDGRFSDLFRIDYRRYTQPEWVEECTSVDRYSFEVALTGRAAVRDLFATALAQAGLAPGDVDHVLMQNVTARSYSFFGETIGHEIHPVCAANLRERGHLGAMDVIANLDALLRDPQTAPGDVVVIINAAPVAAWTVSIVEV